ncbi:radical SAM protein [Amycolatopsis sp. NPDC026612]|uniref:radical SAM/SPASM domain-containing protein n=1 Tax=Amycolatopsis sp. NPDC026612 TaxID=3155466 RepID=UPI0033FB17A2
MNSPARPALALSASDLGNAQDLLVRSCEDCACPPSGGEPERAEPEPDGRPLVRTHGVLQLAIDDEHVALFSPSGNGGVVVLNTEGRAIFDLFAAPCSPDGAMDFAGADVVVRKLLAHGLVHPVGEPPRQEMPESKELTAWLHVTNKCNLRCPYCYVHKSEESMDSGTARESVDALVRSAVKNGFTSLRLKYAGGEASLNAGVLLELHEYAAETCATAGVQLSAVLLSNGVAISRRLAQELKRLNIRVMISLDGIGDAHDAQRPTLTGRPSAARVLQTIDKLCAEGVSPHLSITITSRNVDAVAEVVRFGLDRDLTFSFNFFRDNDCAAAFTDLQYEEQALLDGLRAAFTEIERTLPRWSVLGSILDRGQLLRPRSRTCGVGDDYVVIDQRGRIAQCHMELEDAAGDVRTTDPVQAVRDPARKIKNLLVDEKTGCRDCTWKNWCAGGCAVATFRATGRYDIRSPNCEIYRAIYPEAVRLEGLRLLAHAGSPLG